MKKDIRAQRLYIVDRIATMTDEAMLTRIEEMLGAIPTKLPKLPTDEEWHKIVAKNDAAYARGEYYTHEQMLEAMEEAHQQGRALRKLIGYDD